MFPKTIFFIIVIIFVLPHVAECNVGICFEYEKLPDGTDIYIGEQRNDECYCKLGSLDHCYKCKCQKVDPVLGLGLGLGLGIPCILVLFVLLFVVLHGKFCRKGYEKHDPSCDPSCEQSFELGEGQEFQKDLEKK